MRVLLAEDELQAGQSLFQALKAADYTVDWVRDEASSSIAIKSTYYTAVLLAHGTRSISGLDLLRACRHAGNPVPVLILAAPDDLETRVHSLEIGADDCVAKPLNVREVLARLRAVLRRRAGYASSRIGDESLSLDLDARTLRYNGVESALSAREFAIMHALLERPGTVLSRRQLEDRVYGWGKEIASNAVDVLIHSMRKKHGQTLIHNVRGLGWSIAHQQRSDAARRHASSLAEPA